MPPALDNPQRDLRMDGLYFRASAFAKALRGLSVAQGVNSTPERAVS